jgi:hypothetical protein
MADAWYYSQNGLKWGPLPLADLKRMATQGRLQPGDLVWSEAVRDWAPAGSVPELRSALPRANAAPPATAKAAEWYYARDGKQQGPVAAAQLQQLAESGRLGPDDLVWREGMPGWVPSRTVFPPATPPAPAAMPPPPGGPVDQARGSWQQLDVTAKAAIVGGVGLFALLLCGGAGAFVYSRIFSRAAPAVAQAPDREGALSRPDADRKNDERPRPVAKDEEGGPATVDPVGEGVLTADYLPHRPGRERFLLTDRYLPSGAIMRTRVREEHRPGGLIELTQLKEGTVNNGEVRWLQEVVTRGKYSEHHRRRGEFIEIGRHVGDSEAVTWEKVLKVGARLNDTWEQDLGGGVRSRATVVEFGRDGDRPAARVRYEQLLDGSPQTETLATYVKGVGLVRSETKSNAVNGGRGEMFLTMVRMAEP